jgi:hypothetical protein
MGRSIILQQAAASNNVKIVNKLNHTFIYFWIIGAATFLCAMLNVGREYVIDINFHDAYYVISIISCFWHFPLPA